MLQCLVFLFALRQMPCEGFVFYGVLNVVDGGNSHFDSCITFPQKLYSILFDHKHAPFHSMNLVCVE